MFRSQQQSTVQPMMENTNETNVSDTIIVPQDEPTSKRGRYIPHACTECKKRKVRCSGEDPCSQCADSRTTCQYTVESRKRRQVVSNTMSNPETSAWRQEITNQLASIASDVKALKDAGSVDSGLSIHSDGSHGLTENLIRQRGGPPSQRPPCWLESCSDSGACYLRELHHWDAEITHKGLKPLQGTIHIYFTMMYPHYPCLEETVFNDQFARYAHSPYLKEVTLERIQFIILSQLLLAKVSILEDFCDDDKNIPGWSRFLRAHHLMNHIIQDRKADLTTIQCLVLKSLYLLYLERADSAYDEMGTAVRLIFQLRLHDQSSWTDLSESDMALRKRLIYSIYTLERNISHHLGSPSRIDDRQINVDLPNAASEPYLVAAVKWSRLLSEIWTATSCPQAPEITQEFIAMTEAKITVMLANLPEQLQWSTTAFVVSGYERYPHVVTRQAIVMHLRSNYLRLVMRARDPTTLKFASPAFRIAADVAISTIEAMHAYHNSPTKQNPERYTIVTYLPTAMAALSTVIWEPQCDPPLLANATNAFEKSVELLESISSGFRLGCRLFERLQTPIKSTMERITQLGAQTKEFSGDQTLGHDEFFSMACEESMQIDALVTALGGGSGGVVG
ncbi:fungal-specific transcription factor domain-containing protein [Ilyonectria sp. MPI-CAGE-AT-0026]|nr:fungal-specific transcription factor domain-containing protein [Ilyonectria sp. MPI-CAGE-AT-0026]